MQKTVLIAVLCTALAPLTATAEVTGAQVGLQYSGYGDADARDMHKTSLGGAMEYAITPEFSVQGDVAQRYYGVASWEGTTGTVHGTYHASNGAALGAFYGHDWIKGKDSDYYGVEGAQSFNQMRLEGYAGYIRGASENKGTTLGGSATFAATDRLGLGGEYGMVNNDDKLQRLGATATYAFPAGYAIDGEIGMADRANSDKEAFVSLGVRATFGGQNGVTFGERGLQALYPGR
ncbi:hypothetical protein [Paenirhodobacter enshiensis]|nr:hypothetical protein [Paenirhodobacter enshiensis]